MYLNNRRANSKIKGCQHEDKSLVIPNEYLGIKVEEMPKLGPLELPEPGIETTIGLSVYDRGSSIRNGQQEE